MKVFWFSNKIFFKTNFCARFYQNSLLNKFISEQTNLERKYKNFPWNYSKSASLRSLRCTWVVFIIVNRYIPINLLLRRYTIITIIDDIVRRDTCKPFVKMYSSSLSTTFTAALTSQLPRLKSESSIGRLLSTSKRIIQARYDTYYDYAYIPVKNKHINARFV